ncbi:MAG: ATP-binding protein [Centipeda sp. (in: firmicutes)]
MHPSPMIELMQYPLAVPMVTLLYTAVHILPVNLIRLYIFRRYLRFAPLPIIAGLLLLTGIEAAIQIEAVTVFSRRIAFPFLFFIFFYLLAMTRVPIGKQICILIPPGLFWFAMQTVIYAVEDACPIFDVPFLLSGLCTIACLPIAVPLFLYYGRTIAAPLLADDSFDAVWTPLAWLGMLILVLTILLSPFNDLRTHTALFVRLSGAVGGFCCIGLALYAMNARLRQRALREQAAREAEMAAVTRQNAARMEENDRTTRTFRTQFTEMIAAARVMLAQGDTAGIERLMGDAASAIQTRCAPVCANETVNILVGYWQPIFERLGVQTAYHIEVGAENPIAPLDLTAILGNLLRNAAEALERVAPDAPRILRLALVHQGDTLFLTADNSYDGELRYDAEEHLLSSKRGYTERGVGMESIRASLEHYGGTMEIAAEGELFAVSIVLQATADSAANGTPTRTDGCEGGGRS